MSINEEMFEQVYQECCSIISASSDKNILAKQKKLKADYDTLCARRDPELQEFYGVVHELRTYQYFSSKGFSGQAANDDKAGPDFLFDGLGFVECVSATKGSPQANDYALLEIQPIGTNENYRALQVRLSSVIKSKKDKIDQYLIKKQIDETTPRIIAVGSSTFNSFPTDCVLEAIKKILFGVGALAIRLDCETLEPIASTFEEHIYDDTCKKSMGKTFPVNYFSLDDYANISAVALMNNDIGDRITDSHCFLLLNPNASIPLQEDNMQNFNYFSYFSDETGGYLKFHKIKSSD